MRHSKTAPDVDRGKSKKPNQGIAVSVSDGGAIMHIESVFPGAYRVY